MEDTFSFMPADCLHDRRYTEDTEFLAIGFLMGLPFTITGGIYKDPDGKVLSILKEFREEFTNKKNNFQLRLDLLTVEILIQIDRLLNAPKKENETDSLTYIKNYIDMHYNEKINFANLADLSFYSYDHFRHKFKEFAGYPPNNYLMHRRMESAREKLIRTDKNIIDIAMECGFTTSAQFCHLFKKYCRQTPLEYRKENSPAPIEKLR